MPTKRVARFAPWRFCPSSRSVFEAAEVPRARQVLKDPFQLAGQVPGSLPAFVPGPC